jgi:hypothetical protein
MPSSSSLHVDVQTFIDASPYEVDFIFVHTNHDNTRVADRFETRPTGYVLRSKFA